MFVKCFRLRLHEAFFDSETKHVSDSLQQHFVSAKKFPRLRTQETLLVDNVWLLAAPLQPVFKSLNITWAPVHTVGLFSESPIEIFIEMFS